VPTNGNRSKFRYNLDPSINAWCDNLEKILNFKLLSERFRGPLKTLWRVTCGLPAANCSLVT